MIALIRCTLRENHGRSGTGDGQSASRYDYLELAIKIQFGKMFLKQAESFLNQLLALSAAVCFHVAFSIKS